MKKILVFILAATCIACKNSSSENAGEEKKDSMENSSTILSEEEKNEGFQLLFDGVTSKGWHEYGKNVAGSAWKAVAGALTLDASQKADGIIVGGGDIVTDEEFENFHLKLEWKVDTNGNSGIMFYVHEDTTYKII